VVTGGVSSMAGYAGAGGVAGMGGPSGTGGTGGTTNVGGAASIGTCAAAGGTTVVPFATTPGASVLVSSATRVIVSYSSGTYPWPSGPVGAECRPGIWTYTLDLISQRLWWDDCSVVGDPEIADSYFREVGSTCLSSSDFESARAALSLVTVTGEGQCVEYFGSSPVSVTTTSMTLTGAAGSQMYGDEKTCEVAVGSEGLSNSEQILASLANAARSAGVSVGSCGIAGAGGTTSTAGGPTMGNAILLFGGENMLTLGDTWQWDGSRWTLLKPAHSPRARYDAAVGTLGGRVVLFGGDDSTSAVGNDSHLLGDTWRWDGTDWTQPCSVTSAPPRQGGAMPTLNGTLFLFGGEGSFVRLLDDTWVWDGSSWREGYTPRLPLINSGVMATLDGRVVLFGGDGAGGALGETWTWDGVLWTKAKPAQSPPARYLAAAATLGSTIVVFGGFNGIDWSNGVLNDTWTWDGATWTQQHPLKSPSARTGAAMATLGDRVILFGGEGDLGWLGDTWAWDGSNWTQVATSGPSPRANAAMSGP